MDVLTPYLRFRSLFLPVSGISFEACAKQMRRGFKSRGSVPGMRPNSPGWVVLAPQLALGLLQLHGAKLSHPFIAI